MKKNSTKQNLSFISLSGAIADHGALDRAASYFTQQGWQVSAPEATFAKHMRFAGTVEQRINALNEVLSDRSPGLVMASRGGYGATHLAGAINWKKLAKSPKQFIGMSDFTVINLGLLAKEGKPSWHGPLAVDFGQETISSFTEEQFITALASDTWQLKVKAKSQPKVEAKGTLWGGNLCTFCSLMGTPYMAAIKGGILFFEDIAEHPYRVERQLMQLKHSGILDRQKAVVLGQFTAYKLTPNDQGYDFGPMVEFIRTQTKTPILTGLPIGHVPDMATLPYGTIATLESIRGGYQLSFNSTGLR
jgi:muramoyltetrapeptide carboxypeptidase